jgi:Ni/Fe-hydrogenase 1 B-type cytochrome subunit
MSAHSKLFPVYVWQVPVRIWHWVMALAMVVLCVTGYFIGSPLPSVGGEASNHYLFGYIRFAHFAAAYVFAITFVLRSCGRSSATGSRARSSSCR